MIHELAEQLGEAFTSSTESKLRDPGASLSGVQTLALLLSCAAGDDGPDAVQAKARQLMDNFGSLGAVLRATEESLRAHGLRYQDITLLHTVLAAQLHVLKAEITKGTEITSFKQLKDYLTAAMAYEPTEKFKVLFLDRKNILIKDENMGVGTVDHVPVYPREVVKRALELNASHIILAHNHPSGNPQPSDTDIDMTNQIIRACETVGIEVHDHVIVGHNRNFVSMRTLNLI